MEEEISKGRRKEGGNELSLPGEADGGGGVGRNVIGSEGSALQITKG